MAILTVTNANDDGLGSLRQAISDANATAGFDTIEFDDRLSGQKISLTSGELQITDDLTIQGLGADRLTISGNNISPVFLIDDGDQSNQIDVVIDGLTITEGTTADNGGGILNRENLTVSNSTISDNTGGGIFSAGFSGNPIDLTVSNSTISDNIGGGIFSSEGFFQATDTTIADNTGVGIGVFNGSLEVTGSSISGNSDRGIGIGFADLKLTDSTISDNTGGGIGASRVNLEITNSTISGNTTAGDGGGISASVVNGKITNSTIANNTADSNGDGVGNGGGVEIFAGEIEFNNTIIAGNFDNSPPESDLSEAEALRERHPDISGFGFASNGYNLIGDITGISFANPFTATGDLIGTSDRPIDPLLDSLQDNGGSTQTHALLDSSPAIDAGDPNFMPPPEFDQRGADFPRILDGNGDGIAIVDIGAFEFASIINGTPDSGFIQEPSTSDSSFLI
ncbi:right-handed parallel beta-helix repeat-containing protein [Pleurocapsales cyanobacterium LEGE 06147]|nr:right-handed parallel beta-helix repeat-containing protein [Pleurocapsales cyanobacterium LEGE 06147]